MHFSGELTLDLAKEAIKGKDEFVVKDCGSYSIVNYTVAFADTFPEIVCDHDAILRELRGAVFDNTTGECISRRYHKFFNVGEREETLPENLDFSKPHVVLEKLDGSMVAPFIVPGTDKIVWA